MKHAEMKYLIEDGYEEYLSNVVWDTRDNVDIIQAHSRLDYAFDRVPYDYCGDWCSCGDNLHNWMDWLRAQEIYPKPSVFKFEDLFRIS